MLSIRHHASTLVAALLLALGVAMPQVSQAADAFTITAPLAGRAVTSCSDVTMSGGTIDSAGVSSPSPANKGNVATNGNITLSGSSTIQGDATVGPGKRVTTSGTAHVTGTTSVAASTFDCKPIDLVALKTTLQSSNDNARIPQTGQHKNPLTGANHTDFVMSGTDTLTLPAGTYYFTNFVVSGSSVITVNGPVHILCSGTVSMSGTSAITGTTSYNLHLWVSGASVALSSATIKGFVYAPSASVSLASATLVGSVFANSVTMSGSAHVTRTIDDVAPRVAITSPADNSGTSDPAHVLVKGTVADDQTDVSVKVNGQPAAIASDGTWQITLDLSGGASPVTVSAVATDAAGNTTPASIHIITAPPAISLTSPLPGAVVATRTVSLSGAAGTATTLTVNGTPATISGGVWSLGGFDLGPDGAHALTITGTNAAGPTTITPIVTDDTTPPTITAAVTPAPNAAGWNKSAATVTFTCSDATSGIATCPASVTVTVETTSQVVSGTAIDRAGNQRSALVTVKLDATAPLIAITAPANGTSVITPSVSVSGTVSDTLSGVGGVTCNTAPATVSGGSFTCVVPLVAGQNTITATATDVAGNTASDTRLVTLATLTTVAVTPSSSSLAIGSTATLTARATYSDGTNQDVTASAAWISSAANVASVNAGTVTAVASGSATITATWGSVSGSATITVTNPAPTLTALAIIPSSANLQVGGTLQLRAQATYSDNSTADVTAQANWTTSSSPVATVSSAGLVTAVAPGNVTIGATVGGVNAMAPLAVGSAEPLPPDPTTVAPPIDPTVMTTIFESTKFLYTGSNPIQRGVTPNAIDSVRAAVLKGRVLARGGQPLPGAAVTIASHPEYGHTLSRADGFFDLSVNGQDHLTIQYRKSGYIPVDRDIAPAANDFAFPDDVVLTPLDTAVTAIDLTAAGMQVARGNASNDASGLRRATVFFPSGTSATMTLSDGSTQPISTLHIRATELSVGTDGPLAMPAALPPSSAYTYCLDLSADEARAADAKSVVFSQPVSLYVENFLGFPVGSHIPVGFYDPETTRWVAAPNGKVISIVSIQLGVAYLDVTGDGLADGPDALAQLGITDAERQMLAATYNAGQQLWRVPIAHFSTPDLNWPFIPRPGAGGAQTPRRPTTRRANQPGQRDDCSPCEGSIIYVERQGLGEDLPLAGTTMGLYYESSRLRQIGPNQVEISVIGDDPPPQGTRVELIIDTAGQHLVLPITPVTPHLTRTFQWNLRDAYNRIVQGSTNLTIRTRYTYKASYQVPDVPYDQLHAPNLLWGQMSGLPGFSLDQQRAEYSFTSEATSTSLSSSAIGQWSANGQGFGGWMLSAQHFYDFRSGILYMGDGGRRQLQGIGSVITTLSHPSDFTLDGPLAAGPDGSIYFGAANEIRRMFPSGTVAIVASISDSNTPPARMSVARDGSIYLSEPSQHRVRVVRNGVVSVLTMINPFTSSPVDPLGIANDAQGDLWVADGTRLFKVSPGGQILDWIGNGENGGNGDGGSSHQAQMQNPTEVAVSPDGLIFFSSPSLANIRYVTPDGIVHPVRTGSEPFGSGGPLRDVHGFVADSDHNIYVTGGSDFTDMFTAVDIVHPDGTRSRFAGNGSFGFAGDLGPALQAQLNSPHDVAVAADGAILISDVGNNRIRRVARPMPGLGRAELAIPSDGGGQLFIFGATGRHLRTVNALTGDLQLAFGYDANGYLTSVTDIYGSALTVEREPVSERPLAVVAPGGQRTTLSVGEYLSGITNPAGEPYAFTYSTDHEGRMMSLTDPKHQTHSFTYDDLGLLQSDADPAGGSTTLTRSGASDQDYTITRQTAEGRQSAYHVTVSDDGSYSETMTDQAGHTSRQDASADGNRQYTYPDSTNANALLGPDPRFGMQAPVTSATEVSALGLQRSTQHDVSVTQGADGSLLTLTDTVILNNRVFNSTFDLASRTAASTSAEGRVSSSTLNAQGKPDSVSVPNIAPATFAYDSRGRLSSVTQGSRVLSYAHNTLNELVSVTDPLQRTVSFAHDAAGRITSQTLPDGRVLAFGYDADGNLTSITPPGRPTHNFEISPVDLTTKYLPPVVSGAGATQYAYNRDKQLTSVIRPDGSTIALGYDTAGRPASMTIGQGTYTYAYADAGGGGKLKSVTTPGGVETMYAFDGPMMTSAQMTGTDVAATIQWTYDNDFRLTSEKVSCQTGTTVACAPVQYTYDRDSLLTMAATPAGQLILSRDAQNGLLTGSSVQAISDQWTYNAFGEPASYAANLNGDTPFFTEQMTRDDAGRITEKVETIAGVSTTFDYGYDSAGRLSVVSTNGANSATYTYDANSNRLLKATPSGSESGTYDAQDRMTSYAGATYALTANGDLQSKTDAAGTTNYTYDELCNLIAAILPDGRHIDYVVDGQNRRIAKKVNGVVVQRLVYSDALRPAAEVNGSGEVVTRFVYGTRANCPDLISKGDNTYRIIADHLGSPRLIVNIYDGIVVQQMDYDEFGNVTADSNPGFQPFGFAGGLYDQDTKLVQFGARDYDPHTGRWTIKDPILFSGGNANIYSYVDNDPITFIDPSGLILCPTSLPGIGATYLDDHFSPAVEDFLTTANELGVHDLRVTSAFRSTQYQQQLRANPSGNSATTPAANSLHSAGWAIDVNFRTRSTEDRQRILDAADATGLSWGGNFSKPDRVHFYIDPTGGSKKLRKRLIRQAQNDYNNGGACGCN
jgi:RHS repeat-associated protein